MERQRINAAAVEAVTPSHQVAAHHAGSDHLAALVTIATVASATTIDPSAVVIVVVKNAVVTEATLAPTRKCTSQASQGLLGETIWSVISLAMAQTSVKL